MWAPRSSRSPHRSSVCSNACRCCRRRAAAALIAPRLVLTAAHCVWSEFYNEPYPTRILPNVRGLQRWQPHASMPGGRGATVAGGRKAVRGAATALPLAGRTRPQFCTASQTPAPPTLPRFSTCFNLWCRPGLAATSAADAIPWITSCEMWLPRWCTRALAPATSTSTAPACATT